MTLRPQKTKIVATIGPACDAPAVLEQMIRAGMSVARLNFSHGTFDEHAARIERLRAAAKAVGREIALMADLPGPKIAHRPACPGTNPDSSGRHQALRPSAIDSPRHGIIRVSLQNLISLAESLPPPNPNLK